MRWGQAVLGVLMLVIGVVWFLQGIRVLPGSFMTGSTFWEVAGAIAAIAGIVVLVRSAHRRP